MKKIIPFVLLTAVFACQNKAPDTVISKTVTSNDSPDLPVSITDKRDTINYTGPDGLKQGKWIEFKDNMMSSGAYSPKIREGTYNKNLKNGLWVEYYGNEKLKSKITYANGKLEGYAAFYDTKQNIIKEGNYKNGVFVEGK